MKRVIPLLLCLCLLMGLAACGSSAAKLDTTAAPAAEATAPAKEAKYQVGYSKYNITPTVSMDLWGYAQLAGERMSDGYLDPIYLTCVAITDPEGNTILMYAADLGDTDLAYCNEMRQAVNRATDIPENHMFFNATHTHSAPDGRKIKQELQKAAVQTAQEALADRKPADMYFGTAETAAISFVRHYYEKNGAVVTDNHGNTTNPDLDRHTTEIDREMRVIQFKREGGKDVLLINWQSHPHLTGGTQKHNISADIIGTMRMELEAQDYLPAYYQGGAGNINPTSRIKEEEVNPGHDYKVHGKYLAEAAVEALGNSVKVEPGVIQVTTETYTCKTNQEDLDLVEAAQQVVDYYKEGHSAVDCKPLAESLGLASYYHAAHLLTRGSLGDHLDVEIGVITMGDFAWCTMPGEFFDTTTKYIRDNSPYTYTFAAAYTNGYFGYFASQEAWDYGCYETDTAKVAPGTAEGIANRLLEMLATHK